MTRPFEDPDYENPKYRYAVPDNIKYTIVKIYDVADKIEDKIAYTKALYCLRGGVGFGANGEDVAEDAVEYTEIGEMHENAKTIIDKMKEYKTGKNGTELNLDRWLIYIMQYFGY